VCGTGSVPIYVVDGTAENMKVTEPIDVHIADKIFQLQSASLALDTRPGALPDLSGRTVVVFGGSYGIGASAADLAGDAGADVFEFSRSTTGTDVRHADAVRRALDDVVAATGRVDIVLVTAGVLRVAPLVDAPAEDLADTIETNLLAPIMIAREAYPHLAATAGQGSCSPRAPTPAAAPATACTRRRRRASST
jgi:ribitol-5-phosphate 2-dehydrogenase (NADP+) / D-ribitol-5-phosphate cytidylyltransferase